MSGTNRSAVGHSWGIFEIAITARREKNRTYTRRIVDVFRDKRTRSPWRRKNIIDLERPKWHRLRAASAFTWSCSLREIMAHFGIPHSRRFPLSSANLQGTSRYFNTAGRSVSVNYHVVINELAIRRCAFSYRVCTLYIVR